MYNIESLEVVDVVLLSYLCLLKKFGTTHLPL